MEEYREGKADTISGFEMPDGENGRKAVLHFKTMRPGMNTSNNGYIWEAAAPYHYLKDVKFKYLMSSDKIRKRPMFYGPYKLQNLFVVNQLLRFQTNTITRVNQSLTRLLLV
ncbi:hypothetical protein IMAU60201_00020 [Lactobacillus helveticus]|nr:hypothetical protein [Lactobacillus helveticus]